MFPINWFFWTSYPVIFNSFHHLCSLSFKWGDIFRVKYISDFEEKNMKSRSNNNIISWNFIIALPKVFTDDKHPRKRRIFRKIFLLWGNEIKYYFSFSSHSERNTAQDIGSQWLAFKSSIEKNIISNFFLQFFLCQQTAIFSNMYCFHM